MVAGGEGRKEEGRGRMRAEILNHNSNADTNQTTGFKLNKQKSPI